MPETGTYGLGALWRDTRLALEWAAAEVTRVLVWMLNNP
jgi:hypothetical protein